VSKIIWLYKWIQTSRFKYLVSIFLLLTCFLNYTFNYTQNLFGFRYGQNFLDFTFSIPILAAWIIFLYLFIFTSSWFKVLTALLFCLNGLQFYFTPAFHVIPGYHNFTTIIHLLVWIYLLVAVYKSNFFTQTQQFWLFGGLFLYSSFDYFLLYSPQLIVFLFALGIFFDRVVPSKPAVASVFKYILIGFFSLNLFNASFQLLFSRSLGLKYLGEQFLSLQMTGVAKQSLGSLTILRGYGITSHPNVLGFLAVCGLLLALLPRLKTFWGSWRYFLAVSCAGLVIMSFSRVSWLSLAIILLLWTGQKLQSKSIKFSLRLITASTIFIFFSALSTLTFERILNSDQYRFLDLTQYFKSVTQMSFEQLFFGLGLGRYPEFLFTNFNLPMWQYQPVHNIFLGLILELGIVPIILSILILTVYQFHTITPKALNTNKLILYTTYFQSKSQTRQAELDYCLQHNLHNNLIDKIVIWCETLPIFAQNNKNIVQINDPKIPTFLDFVEHANIHYPRQNIILANSDIYFDSTLNLIHQINLQNKFLTLTRIEQNGKLSPEGKLDWADNLYSHSQDVWIFKSPLKQFKCDFQLGKVACENRLAAEAYFAGLEVLNPSLSINVYHKHASQVRTWRPEESYHGFRAFPVITDIQSMDNKVQVIWE
jgi:hypothetical protein